MQAPIHPAANEEPNSDESSRDIDRRTADPLALAIRDWAKRQAPSVVELLYHENARWVPTDGSDANLRDSLRACATDLGGSSSLTRDAYRLWFAGQPRAAEWASPWEIRRVYPRWHEALSDLTSTPSTDIEMVSAGGLGRFPAKDSLLDLLRQWHAQRPDPRRRHAAFRAWMTSQLQAGALDLPARSVSHSSFRRHFGDWQTAVDAAGLLEGMTLVDFAGLVGSTLWDRSEVERALLDWADWSRLRGEALTVAKYNHWRDEQIEHRWRTGVSRGLPGRDATKKHFGSFLDALVELEIIDASELHRRRAERGDRLTPLKVAELVVCAEQATDAPLDRPQYRKWRDARMKRLQEIIPSAATVVSKLGADDFSEAVVVAHRLLHLPAPHPC